MRITSFLAIAASVALVAFLVLHAGKNPIEESAIVRPVVTTPAPVAVAPTPTTTTAAPSVTPPTTTQNDPSACVITATKEVTLFNRPSESSGVFGALGINETRVISAKTKDGWYGFDPGVAQAGNIGPFRLRYIHPLAGDYSMTTANCANLAVIESIPANTCFMMAQSDIQIYPSASTRVTPKYTMHAGDYIQVLGKSIANSDDYFMKVDSSKYGPIKGTVVGWIQSDDANYSGDACTNLAVVK